MWVCTHAHTHTLGGYYSLGYFLSRFNFFLRVKKSVVTNNCSLSCFSVSLFSIFINFTGQVALKGNAAFLLFICCNVLFQVVFHIHRAIASRHLPMSGIAMVHFDSHPDLLLPLHLQADDVFDKDKLYRFSGVRVWGGGGHLCLYELFCCCIFLWGGY